MAACGRLVLVAATLSLLAACQTSEPDGGSLKAEVQGESSVSVLQRVNSKAYACWIKSGDKAFKPYSLIPELDTTGTPRILVIPRGKPQSLPQLVITASGSPVQVSTFGPLAQSKLSARINSDVLAWTGGRDSCT